MSREARARASAPRLSPARRPLRRDASSDASRSRGLHADVSGGGPPNAPRESIATLTGRGVHTRTACRNCGLVARSDRQCNRGRRRKGVGIRGTLLDVIFTERQLAQEWTARIASGGTVCAADAVLRRARPAAAAARRSGRSLLARLLVVNISNENGTGAPWRGCMPHARSAPVLGIADRTRDYRWTHRLLALPSRTRHPTSICRGACPDDPGPGDAAVI